MADIGIALRNARIQRGLTVDQAAQDTRISARFLEALEAEDFDALPAPVYVRGFLRSYASYLRLDAAPMIAALGDGGSEPVAGPDAFVRGPAVPRPRSERPDPWRPPPRPGSAAPPSRAEPPPPLNVDEEPFAGGEEPVPDEATVGAWQQVRGAGLPPAEATYRPRRVAGVLVERERQGSGGSGARVLAMAALAVVVVGVLVAVAVAMSGGSGGNDAAGVGVGGPTSTPGPRTVIIVGSPTPAPAASASPAPGVSGTPGSPTPAGTPAAAATTGTATPTAAGGTATPAATATPVPTQAAPTPTEAPPTPAPTPTPIPTALPTHPTQFQECVNYSCGDPPLRVVCAPDGTWFVDLPPHFTVPDDTWRVLSANTTGQASKVCN